MNKLPELKLPYYKTKLPSTGAEVEYRPFLVKEQKVLLMALEGKDHDEITSAVKRLIENCVQGDIDINKLAVFDLEYLFLKIRAKSVSEQIEFKIGHRDSECSHQTAITLNLDDIKVVGDLDNTKIMITDSIGVKVHAPTFNDLKNVSDINVDGLFKIVCNCVEFVYNDEDIIDDFTPEQMEEWLGKLNQEQFDKIAKFFNNLPKLSHTVKWKCSECGEKDEYTIEGLQSFFILD